MTETPISNANPLTGAGLLTRYQTLKASGMSHGDIAVECGYYLRVEEGKKAGEIRASTAKLNAALLRAQGLDVPEPGTSQRSSRGGKTKVVINSQGRANLSQAMVNLMGAVKGDYLELVEANEQGIALRLVKAEAPAPAPLPV